MKSKEKASEAKPFNSKNYWKLWMDNTLESED
jgi:hypothetical protein